MAVQHSAPIYPMAVSVWIPNEVEGQISGGVQVHEEEAVARLEAERGWRQAEATAEEERRRRREAEDYAARLRALLEQHGIDPDGGA